MFGRFIVETTTFISTASTINNFLRQRCFLHFNFSHLFFNGNYLFAEPSSAFFRCCSASMSDGVSNAAADKLRRGTLKEHLIALRPEPFVSSSEFCLYVRKPTSKSKAKAAKPADENCCAN